MADDYYKVLGVSRDASQEEIRRAYRELARRYHPDVNPDDAGAKEKFQQAQTAFDVLDDAQKRENYDRYGSAFESMGGGPQGAGGWGGGPGGGPGGGFRVDDIDFSQFFGDRYEAQGGGGGGGGGFGGFADLFGKLGGGGGQRGPRRGADIQHNLTVPFATAVTGGEVGVSVHRTPGGAENLAVKIPPGITDGKKIRLRGQGQSAPGGAPSGDLLLTIRVAPHSHFKRRGNHLDVKVPITLAEAVLGGKIDVPTPKGTLTLTVPPNSSSGTKLRIKGHGVQSKGSDPGDLLAELQIMLPKRLDDTTREAIRQLDQADTDDPRHELRW